jgi:hypothetical protein
LLGAEPTPAPPAGAEPGAAGPAGAGLLEVRPTEAGVADLEAVDDPGGAVVEPNPVDHSDRV